jgi:hypothetical protein
VKSSGFWVSAVAKAPRVVTRDKMARHEGFRGNKGGGVQEKLGDREKIINIKY